MLITSYINGTQHFALLYLVVFEILIPKVRNVFIESPDIFVLTPNSRSVFRAGVSLNIHSFIHSLIYIWPER